MTEIDKDFLDILACPKCKSSVRSEGKAIVCTNKDCGLEYPVRDGIPVMLVDEATEPSDRATND